MRPWSIQEIRLIPCITLPTQAAILIAVSFVTASSTLFNTAGHRGRTHREAISSAS